MMNLMLQILIYFSTSLIKSKKKKLTWNEHRYRDLNRAVQNMFRTRELEWIHVLAMVEE